MSTYDEFLNETLQLMIESTINEIGIDFNNGRMPEIYSFRNVADNLGTIARFYTTYLHYQYGKYTKGFFMRHARWLSELEDLDTRFVSFYNGFYHLCKHSKGPGGDLNGEYLTAEEIYELYSNNFLSNKIKGFIWHTKWNPSDSTFIKLLEYDIMCVDNYGMYRFKNQN